MDAVVISSEAELIEAICGRRDELQLSHDVIDEMAGLPDRYLSKIIGPYPSRGFGEMSLQSVLGALGMRIAVVVLVEDPEQAEKMRPRWREARRLRPRKPRAKKSRCGALLTAAVSGEIGSEITDEGSCHESTNHPVARVAGIPREASG